MAQRARGNPAMQPNSIRLRNNTSAASRLHHPRKEPRRISEHSRHRVGNSLYRGAIRVIVRGIVTRIRDCVTGHDDTSLPIFLSLSPPRDRRRSSSLLTAYVFLTVNNAILTSICPRALPRTAPEGHRRGAARAGVPDDNGRRVTAGKLSYAK